MRLQHRPLAFRRSRNRLVSDIHVPGAASGISLGVAISGRLCSQAKASLRRMGVVVARTSVTLGVLAEGGMRVSETADRRICQAAEMAERSSLGDVPIRTICFTFDLVRCDWCGSASAMARANNAI